MNKKTKITNYMDDIIFSEIDLKETTFNKNKDIIYYSLDIMSDNSSNSGNSNKSPSKGSVHSSISLNLDDYDLDLDDYDISMNQPNQDEEDNQDGNLQDNIDCNIKNISIRHSSDMQDIPNIQDIQDIPNMQDMQDMQDMHYNIPVVAKLPCVQNIENRENIENIPTVENKIAEISSIHNEPSPQKNIEECEIDTINRLNTTEFLKLLNNNLHNKLTEENIQKLQESLHTQEKETLPCDLPKFEEVKLDEVNNVQNDLLPELNHNKLVEDVQVQYELKNNQHKDIIEDVVRDIITDIEEIKEKEVEDKQDVVVIDGIQEKKNCVEDLKNINTEQKEEIWKDLIETGINEQSSYNYLQTETFTNNLVSIISKDILYKFYKLAENNNRNIFGYIDNNKILNCLPNTSYKYEVHTKLTNDGIDPPGNYINIFMNRDLTKTKCIYLLNNNF